MYLLFAAWLTVAPQTTKGTTLEITATPESFGSTSSPKPVAFEGQKYLELGKQPDVMITLLSIIGIVILASVLLAALYFSCKHLTGKIKKLSNFVRTKRTDSNSPLEESLRRVDPENRKTESGNRSIKMSKITFVYSKK